MCSSRYLFARVGIYFPKIQTFKIRIFNYLSYVKNIFKGLSSSSGLWLFAVMERCVPLSRSPCTRRWKASCRRAFTSSWISASSQTCSSCGCPCSQGRGTSSRSCTVTTWSTTGGNTKESRGTPSELASRSAAPRLEDSGCSDPRFQTRDKPLGSYNTYCTLQSGFFHTESFLM